MGSTGWLVRLAMAGVLACVLPSQALGAACPESTGALAWHWPGPAQRVAAAGGFAYLLTQKPAWIGCESATLLVVDLALPTSPRVVAERDLGPAGLVGCAGPMEVVGGLGFVAGDVLRVVDLGDPTAPVMLGRFVPPAPITDIEVSGDLLFASYGPVYGGDSGLVIVDVADPAHLAQVGSWVDPSTAVGDGRLALAGSHVLLTSPIDPDLGGPVLVLDVSDPANPVQVGLFATLAEEVAVAGDLAYLAGFSFQVLDVVDPASPVELGALELDGAEVEDIAVAGDLVYLATADRGLITIDVTNPAHPVRAAGSVPGAVSSVVVSGDRAHLAAGERGYRLVDVSEPDEPVELASLATSGRTRSVALADGLAYVAAAGAGLRVVDVADAAALSELGAWSGSGSVVDVAMSEQLAVVAWLGGSWTGGLSVVDLSDPALPVELGAWPCPERPQAVAVAGSMAFLVGSVRYPSHAGLWAVDISDPYHPQTTGEVTLPSSQLADVAIAGQYAYVAAGSAGMRVVDVSAPSTPVEVGHSYAPRYAAAVAVEGAQAWVADGQSQGDTRVVLLDVADPMQPLELTRWQGTGPVAALAAHGSLLFLLGEQGLQVVDGSTAAGLTTVTSAAAMAGTAVEADGDTVVVATGDGLELLAAGCLNTRWLDVAAHLPGRLGSEWRTDLVAFNPTAEDAAVEIVLHGPDGDHQLSESIPAFSQLALEDLVGRMGSEGKGPVEVRSDRRLIVLGRTYNSSDSGTYGQLAEGLAPWQDVQNGGSASLLGLRQLSGHYRTNISVANIADEASSVLLRLLGSDGEELLEYSLQLAAGEMVQDLEPLRLRAGLPDLGWGQAMVSAVRAGKLVSASVIDSRTNDGTTVPPTREPVCELASDCPQMVGRVGLRDGNVVALAHDGRVAYVGGNGEMYAVSVSDPAVPIVLATVELNDHVSWPVEGISLSEGYAYVADGQFGLEVVDVSDPARPIVVGNFPAEPYGCSDVVVRGHRAFILGGRAGLSILDVSDPADPVELGRYEVPDGYAKRLVVAGGHAYIAAQDSGLRVVDISDPMAPFEVGSYILNYGVNDVAVAGDLAYLAAYADGLCVLDVSDPTTPVEVARLTQFLWADNVEVAGDLALVTDDSQGLILVDVSDPSVPRRIGGYYGPNVGRQLALRDNVAYVPYRGLEVVDLSCLDAPSREHQYWLEVAAHQAGDFGSRWRTDLVARNLSTEAEGDAAVEIVLHTDQGELSLASTIEPGDQGVYEDVVGLLGHIGKGALEVRSDRPLSLFGRIYNDTGAGTFGQALHAYGSPEGLRAGESAWLVGLRQDEGLFRTNISVTNTGAGAASVAISLYAAGGTELASYSLTAAPGEVVQDLEPFTARAGSGRLGWGFARVAVDAGAGVLASASVVDSRTNDATTVPMQR